MQLTKKMAAEMIFISFCSHYRNVEVSDEIERTVGAINRASLIRGTGWGTNDQHLDAYAGRWKITIMPVLEGLNE